ncbi:AAA family ATPase [Candidatus Micrarchaeota archaeon]|nr:AAA family ATPase [Candidatus Micrarchaeota archaeon]
MQIIIGLTGTNCAGKGTVLENLKKRGFYPLSLSDVIRRELDLEGKEKTRENMVATGNELREKLGAGACAVKVKELLLNDRNYVVDSIRHPAEVDELAKLMNFFLFHVDAKPEIRFERMKNRERKGDAETYERFLEMDKKEMESDDPNAQNLKATFSKADLIIENNGTLEELYTGINEILKEVMKEINPERPGWDEYFMSIAKQVATRSNCMKRQIAAIIVRDKRIISTGYNGTPRGTTNCNEGGCPRCNSFAESGKNLEECYCSHAEENSIVQAAYHGISINGGTIYTTFSPCLYCTRMIINAGIKEVVYNARYSITEGAFRLLNEAGVKIRKFNVDGLENKK